MDQNNAAKLLNEIVQHQINIWERMDALDAKIVALQKQDERLKTRVDRQYMAIAELREQCKDTRRLAWGIILGILLAGIINTILVFI